MEKRYLFILQIVTIYGTSIAWILLDSVAPDGPSADSWRVKGQAVRDVAERTQPFGLVVTGEADPPTGITSLLEHYIRKTKLRTQVAAPMTVSGDCEGQYSLYTGWRTTERFTARREQRPVEVDGMELDPDMPGGEPVDTMVEEKVKEGLPYVELIPDVDLLILPATSDSIEEALEAGQ